MAHWNSSPHPISDVWDWKEAERLELRPDYQRRDVWSRAAQVMLIDTILREVPMPKIFVNAVIRGTKTYRIVIDGQQRLRAIIGFLSNEFALTAPYEGEHAGKRFEHLSDDVRTRILQYPIDFNEASNCSEEELREVYSRVNKYTISLNRQELRRADFPGAFLNLAESLAVEEFFDNAKLFTPANRRRYADVEFVSELLATLLAGPQDKKQALDDFYQQYMKWTQEEVDGIRTRFANILNDITLMFAEGPVVLPQSRFRQKSDFYGLFVAIDQLRHAGHRLDGKSLDPLREDLAIIDFNTEPGSEVDDLSAYAIRCATDANSLSSRRWRIDFISTVLGGTYKNDPPDDAGKATFFRVRADLATPSMCPTHFGDCAVCGREIDVQAHPALAWRPGTTNFQMSNSEWIHAAEVPPADAGWTLVASEGWNEERHQPLPG